MDYFAHSTSSRAILDRLAALEPHMLACMHGSAWRGEGAGLLRALADILDLERASAAAEPPVRVTLPIEPRRGV
jgi:hypothetical protein